MRAVFDLRLQDCRDVIVFSSKGSCPLAEKLSGGDYDGDEAWVCWDDTVVGPFTNYKNPENAHDLPNMPKDEELGIVIDKTTVSELLEKGDFTNDFLEHGFNFILQENMLGICSSYREALCYHGTPVSDPSAIMLGYLLGRLVDRAKAGVVFDEASWKALQMKWNLSIRLDPPAYKDRKNARPTNHLVDRLVFRAAATQCIDTLEQYTQEFKDAGTFDPDLTRVANFEDEEAESDTQYKVLLDLLRDDLRHLFERWISIVQSLGGNEEVRWKTRPKKERSLHLPMVSQLYGKNSLTFSLPEIFPVLSPGAGSENRTGNENKRRSVTVSRTIGAS